jgi:hypothetical protein
MKSLNKTVKVGDLLRFFLEYIRKDGTPGSLYCPYCSGAPEIAVFWEEIN